ncbi:MAG: restriction endonuclease subunit S [Campylobacter sp.]|uniref:restriction endonuclease subunit S n=1 Tax=Campylobacter sp. TaxID=205 RepID=UPI00259D25F8|nr:restriction endonuclease subunit S [Campylobacter sp.]MBQ8608567.1 restriction endonuclease subunit S [Campylobacter sp.]
MQKPSKLAQIPQIRFSGFTDPWERCKLGEVAENTYGGGTPQTSVDSFWNGDIPWIQSQNIIENQLFDVVPQKYISEEAVLKSATKLIPKNSIAIVTRVGVGKLAFMQFSYCTSQDFLSLSGIRIDKKFAVYSIYKMLQKEKENVQGTSIKGITIEELLSKNIELPCNNAEQTKIGELFANLDKLITLHQSKFEKLQKIKKSCLQNLFPQNNQNTPKIRFKNFSDEWENNNLGEICKIIKGEQINKLSLFENGKYYVLNGGISPSGYINTYNTLENTISISEGGNSCGYVKFNIEKFWSGGHNYTLNELKTKTLFLYSFLKAKQQKIMALRVGSGLPNIQKNTLSNISISIPNSEEQEKIGAFFSKLDKLISLQQRKVEKLKNIKKALLNKMLI